MLANRVSRFFIALGLAVGVFMFFALLDNHDWLYIYLIGFLMLGLTTFIFYRVLEPTNDNDD